MPHLFVTVCGTPDGRYLTSFPSFLFEFAGSGRSEDRMGFKDLSCLVSAWYGCRFCFVTPRSWHPSSPPPPILLPPSAICRTPGAELPVTLAYQRTRRGWFMSFDTHTSFRDFFAKNHRTFFILCLCLCIIVHPSHSLFSLFLSIIDSECGRCRRVLRGHSQPYRRHHSKPASAPRRSPLRSRPSF